MEKSGDIDLREFRKKYNTNCFSLRSTKYIMKQLISAIHILNDNNLFHRDIKLNNVVITD